MLSLEIEARFLITEVMRMTFIRGCVMVERGPDSLPHIVDVGIIFTDLNDDDDCQVRVIAAGLYVSTYSVKTVILYYIYVILYYIYTLYSTIHTLYSTIYTLYSTIYILYYTYILYYRHHFHTLFLIYTKSKSCLNNSNIISVHSM